MSSVTEWIFFLPFLALLALVGLVALPEVFGLVPDDEGPRRRRRRRRGRGWWWWWYHTSFGGWGGSLLFGIGPVTVVAVLGVGGVSWSRNVSFLLFRIFGWFCRENVLFRFFIDFGPIFTGFWVLIRSWWWWGGGPLVRAIGWIWVHLALGCGLFHVPSFGAHPLLTKEVARVPQSIVFFRFFVFSIFRFFDRLYFLSPLTPNRHIEGGTKQGFVFNTNALKSTFLLPGGSLTVIWGTS